MAPTIKTKLLALEIEFNIKAQTCKTKQNKKQNKKQGCTVISFGTKASLLETET